MQQWTPPELFGRHRLLIGLFVLGMTALAAWGITRLEFDDVARDVFRSSNDDYRKLQQFLADFESDDSDCLLVVESPDIFAPQSLSVLHRLIDRVRQINGVEAVRSLADVVVFDGGAKSLLPAADASPQARAEARRAALRHPLIRGQVLAEDAQTALIVVRLADDRLGIDDTKPVIAELLRAAAAERQDGVTVRLTGVPAIRVEIYDMVRRETRRFVLIGVALAFLMALFLFRQVWAAVIVACGPILAAFWTLGAMGLVGERLNVINTVLPTLILVVGFADSMHLMMDIRHSLADGLSPLDAAKSAIRHLLVACLLTASTTAIGFGALALAEVEIIRRFGLAAAAGCGLSFISVLTVVPLLASARIGERIRAAHEQDFVVKNFHIFERGLDWILDHARSVTAVGLLVVALLSISMFRLTPDNRLIEMIPRGNDTYQAVRHLDNALGGSLSMFVVIEWNKPQTLDDPEILRAIGAAQSLLRAKPQVHYPLSVLDVLKSLPGVGDDLGMRVPLLDLAPKDVVNRYVRRDLGRALVVGRLADIGSAQSRPLYEEVDRDLAALEKEFSGIRFTLTGTTVVGARNVHKMIESLNQSLVGAAAAIFGAIAIGFRSLHLAGVSIPPNVFPMVATSTLLLVTGRPLQMTSVMVFSICLGIAVDDTIHFLNRFQRELAVDGDVRASIKRAFYAVGSAVITTTLVLLTGFGSVLTSEMPSSRLFGWLSCAAFGTAILGDLILLPALLIYFYPGGKPKRVLRATNERGQAEEMPALLSESTPAEGAR